MSGRGRPGAPFARATTHHASRAARPEPRPAGSVAGASVPPSHPAMLAATAVALAGVLASVTYTLFETDFWQHLLVGKAIWQLGHVPTTQLWSWPSYGDPEVNSAWLFRALIWGCWSLGGVWGLFAWRWAITLAAFGLLWATARRMGARGFAALAVLVACALVYRTRSQIRPETLVAVYLALQVWILETRRHGGPDRTVWIPVIALAWANTHLSYFLGFILLGIHWNAAQAAAWRRGRRGTGADPRPGRLLLVGLAALAASFLNPLGWRALWQPFDFALHWRNEPMFTAIGELQHLPLAALRWSGVAFVLILWPLLLAWRARRRGWDLVEALSFLVFASLAWSSVRFLGYLALVSLPYLARDLDEWVAARRWPGWSAAPWRRAALASVACVALGLPAWSARATGLGVGIDLRYVPERACDFMAAEGIQGRGFNHFHFGGYMLWRFWPERGRLPFATIHPEALRRQDRLGYEAARTSPAGWRALDGRYRFDYALLYRRQLGGDRLLDALDADRSWALVFLDDVAAVFVRRDGPLAAVADRFAYRTAPAGRSAIAALGRACERDTVLRAQAEAELARQSAGSPHDAMASSVLATLELMDGRLDEAEARLRHALEVDPDLPRAHERLGMIALAAGRPHDAVRELERALADRPVTPGLHFALGRAWRQLGRPAKAREQYRAELRRDPGHAGVIDSLRALESGAIR
ncbi:MAG: tetratricopeptide repeat protein [Candidatus Eisenbacteria bacterium]